MAELDEEPRHPYGLRTIMELFDVGPLVAVAALSVAALAMAFASLYVIRSAPPGKIVVTTGPEGSMYQRHALKYKKILEQEGIQVEVLTSRGSRENLERLIDPKERVDVAIAQAGILPSGAEELVSLGSISYQPLMLFYRGKPLRLVSELAGRRIAIGPSGSGSRVFAYSVLSVNGVKEGEEGTEFLSLEGEAAARALAEGKADAAFVMSESSSLGVLHDLLRSKDIHLYSFEQAAAYTRKLNFLNVLELPQGTIDIGHNIPARDVTLLGPMVELVARRSLHPALSDLLLEAATEVHGHAGMYQKRGEFPALIEHGIRLSDDAQRFHHSGKSWLYRTFPFWLASLISRVTVAFLPVLVLLIPALRALPAFFRWKTQVRLRAHYRNLRALEERILFAKAGSRHEELRREFDRIDRAVNNMKVRAAFADQFYALRGHIDYVRRLVAQPRA